MEKKEDEEKRNVPSTPSSTCANVVSGRTTNIFHQCKICGDVALHSNYGVMTCSPCKMFFKRNAQNGQRKFRCDSNSECEVNVNNRHICPACRLDKCFANGMQVELIRCPIARRQMNKEKSVDSHTTSNDVDTTHWNSILTVVQYYNDDELLTLARQIYDEFQGHSSDWTTTVSNLAREYLKKIYQTSANYIRTNNEISSLESNDRSIILRNAAENVTCLASIFTWSRTRIDHCPLFLEIYSGFFRSDSIDFIRDVSKYVDPDEKLFKLAISLFAFSNTSSLMASNNTLKSIETLNIHRIEQFYTDLIWKYLFHHYGAIQSIQRWTNLLQCFLAATNLINRFQSIDEHVNQIDALVEQIELALVLDGIESADED